MAVIRKKAPRAAVVACNGGCRASQREPFCTYGCVGCGICVEVCPVGAITICDIGVAQVDEEACIGCTKCVGECPRQVIHMHTRGNSIVVKCSNRDSAAGETGARSVCSVSCIGCGLCARLCPAEAIRVIDNCARIDDERCLNCGMCAVNCPRGAIKDLRNLLTEPF